MKLFLPVVFAVLAASCAPAPAKRVPEKVAEAPASAPSPAEPSLVVKALRPGIWMHTSFSPDAARFPSNGLIFREGGHVVLLDTAWGDAVTEELLGWIAREVRLPVSYAVITHAHEDRMGGAAALARHNIPMVGHPLTRTRALARGWSAPKAVEDFSTGDVARLGFLEIYFPGPAHSPDNVVVWVASERLLYGGCAVKAMDASELGNVADADRRRWPGALLRITERYPATRIVVPGHGKAGGPELIAHTRQLLAGKP